MADRIRSMVDTVGFATRADQMDAVVERIDALYAPSASVSVDPLRVAIAPHDDYAYVGGLYRSALDGVRAPTVILFGVAHRARTLGLENTLLFESFDRWEAPRGSVAVSSLRDEIIEALPAGIGRAHDEMHAIEHSLEAIVPFLQDRDRTVEIVPILIPAMSFERMMDVAGELALAIARTMRSHSLRWGDDVAMVISNDAVHYGDEGWGGRDFARFGADDEGYRTAVAYEHSIIEECLSGELSPEKVRWFNEHTVDADDFREYRWTWCGRYCVPCGLLTAHALQQELGAAPLVGTLDGYGTSIDGRAHIPVSDLDMGVTAPASLRHWVGYASIGYR
jgi:MEMO1 family protein